MRAIVFGLLLLFPLSACYEYVPIHDAAPPPEAGTEVRAQLTSPQPFNLGPRTLNDITTVEGVVYPNDNGSDSLALWSRKLSSAYGGQYFANGNVFYIPRAQIRQLEQRRLAALPTAVAAAVGTGALVGIVTLLTGGGGGGVGGEGEGGTEAHLIGPMGGVIRIGIRRE